MADPAGKKSSTATVVAVLSLDSSKLHESCRSLRCIFVGNETRRTVEVFSALGQREYTFGTGVVGQPADLAIDSERGLVFVVDGHAGVVKVFDVDGVLQRTIGDFDAPTGIALDPTRREVFVSDYGAGGSDARIHIRDYEGTVAGTIVGEFSRPQGIAVGDRGRIYVTDAVVAQVLVFDRATVTAVARLGSGDPSVSDLRLPTDVVVDAQSGTVFVVSNMTGTVVAFSNPNQP